ncbi:hypothetical protein E2C01_031843 [Portunus trituberculatus]|uniref:Uncharacterized protein n=1 Tax=Portunus trituberculatus TaxID=210409 RepID=A0A5B7EYY2_PORTR|nr:hypothetical protein [Portunus trituberculatus]
MRARFTLVVAEVSLLWCEPAGLLDLPRRAPSRPPPPCTPTPMTAVGGRKDGVTQPPAPFATLASMGDGLQLSPAAVEGRVEPYELVELFYGSGSGTPTSPPSHVPQVSPQHSTGTSSPEVMQ